MTTTSLRLKNTWWNILRLILENIAWWWWWPITSASSVGPATISCVVQSLTSNAAKTLIHAFVSCPLDYCNLLRYGVADGQLQRLQSDRNTAARLVSGTWRSEHIIHADPEVLALAADPSTYHIQAGYTGAKLDERSCAGVLRLRLSTGFWWLSTSLKTISNWACLDVPRTSTSLGSRMVSVAGPSPPLPSPSFPFPFLPSTPLRRWLLYDI